ncbi:MAG: peroxiredoxin, partial [Betaproteobacteria bacterium]|nr:peroxiredoxin [Betaproteobacteria bacterium]
MIAVGQNLPNATLYEFLNEASEGCAIGPNAFEVDKLTAGKKIVIFGLPGAFTPTCSAQHVPGYIEQFDAIKAKGVDEIWCVSVNDPFVMGAWGRDLKVGNKVRMLGDGSAELTQKLGLE